MLLFLKHNFYRFIIPVLLSAPSIFVHAEQENKSYNTHWNAAEYYKNSSAQTKWALDFINKIQFKNEDKILDVGCGDGKVTAYLLSKLTNGKVLGIDISPSMIKFAKGNFKNFPNLDFEICDARNLPFAEEFDVVTSFSCIHWIEYQQEVLNKMAASLKKNGRLYLYFAPKYEGYRLQIAMNAVKEKPEWKKYLADYKDVFFLPTENEFKEMLKKANLTSKRISLIRTDVIFESKENFNQWMKAWLPFLRYLPSETHHQFVDEIIDSYLTMFPIGEDGLLHYYDFMLEVEAFK